MLLEPMPLELNDLFVCVCFVLCVSVYVFFCALLYCTGVVSSVPKVHAKFYQTMCVCVADSMGFEGKTSTLDLHCSFGSSFASVHLGWAARCAGLFSGNRLVVYPPSRPEGLPMSPYTPFCFYSQHRKPRQKLCDL